MKALADSHALMWWLSGDSRLSEKARAFMARPENDVFVSSASVWEISIKNNSGKLQAQPLLDRFEEFMDEEGFVLLPITANHSIRAGALPMHHSDPFDRMLIAQAQAEHVAIISADREFDRYGIRRIW